MGKFICLILGTISLLLGLIGILFPIVPTVPFIMLSMLLYARASKRIYHYFLSKPFIQKTMNKTLTRKERIKVMIILAFWFFLMGLLLGMHLMIVLFIVWIFHLFYFFIYFERFS